MLNSLKITLSLVLAFSVTGLFAQAKKKVTPLDGKVYIVEIIKEGKKKPETSEDPFKFTNGKFKSTQFYDWGLDAGTFDCAYEDSTADVKVVKFTAEMKDKGNGDIATFEGTVRNDSIQGTAAIKSKKGKLRDNYLFSGSVKQKKVPGGAKK
jgi:hypothetical protein